MFCIEASCATVCLQGTHEIHFFQLLKPSHVPTHRVSFMRLMRLLDQAVFREYHGLVTGNALLYGSDFLSTNSDFYSNKERRESYGCIVANMLSQQYIFKVSFLLQLSFISMSYSHFYSSCVSFFHDLCCIGWTTGVCQQSVVQ
jgi:hypothetical protein